MEGLYGDLCIVNIAPRAKARFFWIAGSIRIELGH